MIITIWLNYQMFTSTNSIASKLLDWKLSFAIKQKFKIYNLSKENPVGIEEIDNSQTQFVCFRVCVSPLYGMLTWVKGS